MAIKMVLKALTHLVSQLVAQMGATPVRKSSNDPAFPIPTTAKVTMSPNGYENFYRCLKMVALKNLRQVQAQLWSSSRLGDKALE